uniref:energy transducer TonB n=1 Tax=Parerythrobacter lutipelagi TaxID=1964208 RepID=UPI0010F6443A|nr:energy transducer TonB [Parerythrobacter lutipelagi]
MKSIATAAYEDESGIRTVLGSRDELDRAIETGKIRSDTPITVYFDDRSSSRQPASSIAQLAHFFSITELRIVEGGEAKDRFSAASLEFAISVGEIAPDSEVQLEYTDGGKVIAPAASLPLLASAFKQRSESPSGEEAAKPDSTEPVAPQAEDGETQTEPAVSALNPPASDDPVEELDPAEAEADPELSEPEPDPIEAQPSEHPGERQSEMDEAVFVPQPPSNTGKFVAFGAAGIVLLLLLVWLLGGSGHYAAADVSVYDQPSYDAAVVGEVAYGTELALMPSAEAGWLEITEGPNEGSYIPESFVTDSEPPALDRSAAAALELPRSVPFYGVPDQSAEALGSYGPGTILSVTGAVDGDDGLQYLLFRAASGSVMDRPAYVVRSETEVAQPERAPLPPAAVQEEDVPEPEETQAPERDSVSETCRSRRAGIERLACESPRIAGLDRQLSREWNAARDRFAAQGQTITPLDSFRQRASSCRTENCAARRLQQGIDLIRRQQPQARQTTAPPPPPPPVDRSRQAQPQRDLRSYFRASDYPRRAARDGRQGSVTVMLTIGGNGRVSGCNVTSSSGHSDLDKETCDVLRKRARFTPAADENGRATTGGFGPVSIGWQLNG